MRLLKPVITFNLILFLGSTLSSCRLTTNSGTLDNIYQVTDIITGKDSNGKKGLIFTYYSNGKKFSQEYWKRGKLQGRRIEWYPDGTVKKLDTYKKGSLNGISKKYSEDGELEVHQRYKNDEMVEDLMDQP